MAAAKPIPKEQKIVLGIIAAVGLFMFVKKAYLPQGKEIGKLKTEIAETNKKIEDINRKVAKMKEIKANFEILKLKVIEAEKQLPKSEELPELIRSITKLGEKHGISIDNFMIGSIMPQKYHQEHTYNFNIQSSYHNLAQFFVDVCQKERIMTVK
ncbi:MAG: hypothetical protein COT16_00070, partial [Elusimicrobia bacterium CG08_land_8_20_14_0_20_44_26]